MRFKRWLSGVLVLLMLIACLPVHVSAEKAVWGSTTGGVTMRPISKVPNSNYDPTQVEHGLRLELEPWGRGWLAVRMRAFVLKNDNSGHEAYFDYDDSAKTISMLPWERLVKAEHYADDGWKYFEGNSTHYEFTFVQGVEDGLIFESAAANKGISGAQDALLDACGYTGPRDISLSDARNIDKVFMCDAMLNDETGEQRHKVAKYFGVPEESWDNFYIVTEVVPYFQVRLFGQRSVENGDGDNGLGYVTTVFEVGGQTFTAMEWSAGETLATFNVHDPKVNNRPSLLCGASNSEFIQGLKITVPKGVSDLYKALSGTSSKHKIEWRQGSEALWEGYTTTNANDERVNGYSVYSMCPRVSVSAAGNVAVEYDGDVNTSDPSKFKSTGSLIGAGGTAVGISYWDFLQNKFVGSDDHATLLKFADKIDMTDEYALCFTGISNHNISDDEKLEQRLQAAFETAPGQGYTSSSLTWGSPRATGGDYNVGYVWKVTALDSYTSVVPIINRFQNAFNSASIAGKLSIGPSTADTTSKYSQHTVLDGSWQNFEDARYLSSIGVWTNQNGEYVFKKDEQLGMGYEFIIRGTPVKSREITIFVDGADDGSVDSVSSSQTWEEEYTTAKNIIHPVEEVPDYTFVGWLVVPHMDDSVTTSIENSLKSSRCDIDALFGAAKSGAPTMVESSGATATIGLGSTLEDEPPEGYTVYRIAYKGPPVPQTPGEVILPAYMLNRYFDNVIQTSSKLAGSPQKYTLARDWTWVAWNSWSYCCKGHNHGPNGFERDWVHEYRDTASSEEFGLDNAMIDRYYPKGTGTWSGAQRSKLYGHGWTQAMNTEGMSESAYVVDYAFNLVRANTAFGDKRAVSGISYQSYQQATGDSSDLLRISSDFGVTPKTVKKTAPARNSLAVLKTYTETFNIESRFAHDASPMGNHVLPMETWSCTHSHGSGEDRYTHTVTGQYYPGIQPHLINGFRSINGAYSDKITYQFKASAMKYTTKDDLGAGKNDFLGGSTSKPLTNGRRNSTEGSITPSNFYRFSTVRYTDIDLKFHPENYMVFKIGGTDFAAIGGQPYKMSYVMSEVKRTSKASGMYFFRLNADVTSVPGTVYSDSMQGGSGIFGMGSTVSIPAGSDVTIAADPTGVAIDLYGYSLDLVQPSDDGKIGAVGSGRGYNTVVKSSTDAYGEWGNTDSHEKSLQHFDTWANNILDIKNFAADFELYVGSGTNDLKSENFSATIGRVERGTGGTVEDGIYQLVVEKGILQTGKGDYNALIQQISQDYGCSTGEAKAMFTESAIYTAIINGMETCKNPKNNSKDVMQGLNYTPDILASWTNSLGGDGNWYDETSRTFIIRRFTNLGNKLCDVIATDKIDYQLAPTGGTQSSENVNSALSYNAWWKLNIFFDQNAKNNVNDLLLGSSTYYDPQNGSGNFNPANNAWSVMFNGIPVANADFKIPASSTQDFYN